MLTVASQHHGRQASRISPFGGEVITRSVSHILNTSPSVYAPTVDAMCFSVDGSSFHEGAQLIACKRMPRQ